MQRNVPPSTAAFAHPVAKDGQGAPMTGGPLKPRHIQLHHYNYIQEAYGGRFPVEGMEKVEAFGTQGSVGCVGVYVQINKNEFFIAHMLWGSSRGELRPFDKARSQAEAASAMTLKAADYQKLTKAVSQKMHAVCGPLDPNYRSPLFIICGEPDGWSLAERDGILKWTDIDLNDKDAVGKYWHPGHNGIIVPRPGWDAEILVMSNRQQQPELPAAEETREKVCEFYDPADHFIGDQHGTAEWVPWGEPNYHWDLSAASSPPSGERGDVGEGPAAKKSSEQ